MRKLEMTTVLVVAALLVLWTPVAQVQTLLPSKEELDASAKFMGEVVDEVKSVVEGTFAPPGWRPHSKVIETALRAVPGLVAAGEFGGELDPTWFARYYPLGASLTGDMMTSLRAYAVQMWLIGHTPGYERLRSTLALPDMYELPAGMAQWQRDLLDVGWVITKMKLVSVSYNLSTSKLERGYDSIHHMALLSRIMAFDQYVESAATYRVWVQTHRTLLLVGQRGLDSLIRHAADLESLGHSGARAGDSYAEERDRAWLLFVAQQLVEFADTAHEYVHWLRVDRSELINRLSEVQYDDLLQYARSFVEVRYRGLRAQEVPDGVDPVSTVLADG